MQITGNRKGFAITENIIVMVLLSVLVVSSFNLYPTVEKIFVRQESRLIANNLAYSQIEDLREIARTSIAKLQDTALYCGAFTQTYNSPTPHVILPTGFTLTYTVTYGNWTGQAGPPPVGLEYSDNYYKIVTVTCTHTASGYKAMLTADITI